MRAEVPLALPASTVTIAPSGENAGSTVETVSSMLKAPFYFRYATGAHQVRSSQAGSAGVPRAEQVGELATAS